MIRMTSSLFSDVTRRGLVVSYGRFGGNVSFNDQTVLFFP